MKRLIMLFYYLKNDETLDNKKRHLKLSHGERSVEKAIISYSRFIGKMTVKRWHSKAFEACCYAVKS